MRIESLENLQEAIIAQARASSELGATLGAGSAMRLYDDPPQADEDQVWPFARIGNVETAALDEDGRRGHRINIGIEVADRPADGTGEQDRSRAMRVVAGFERALHRRETELQARLPGSETWRIVEARYETASVNYRGGDDRIEVVAVAAFVFLIDEVS